MMNKFVYLTIAACMNLAMMDGAAGEVPRVTHLIDDDSERTPLHTVVPEYPKNARRDRIEGEVQVCFDVDRKGRTYRVAVRKSTHRIFEKSSRKAVRASTYRPVPKDIELSGIKTCRTFRFELEPVAIEELNSTANEPD
jgi:TonB family protein